MTAMTRDGLAQAAIRLASFLWVATQAAQYARSADLAELRSRMVDQEIVAAGVRDPRVIQALRDTPRHEFVTQSQRAYAYMDMALPIGHSQTISPPFVVAYMTEQLQPRPTDKVLEIGTGSGYQAAVLSPLVKEVYTIEIVKPLGERAARTLKRLKYGNVHASVGDGFQGWPDHAPFDKIIVTCSPEQVPTKLVEQLREGGRMIVPVGQRYEQTLYLFEKRNDQLVKIALLPTLFVPMTGQAEEARVRQPDPVRPEINNGGFESWAKRSPEPPGTALGEDGETTEYPIGWHYQRQLRLVEADDAPEGRRYAKFENLQPGRGSQALQGLAVDGRKVGQLEVSLWVRAKDVVPGSGTEQKALLAITFYDENRSPAGYTWIGPWQGGFDWQKVTERLRVPLKAREAIVRIGLAGATGEISFDDVRIEAVPRP